jgi:hypothetical protein
MSGVVLHETRGGSASSNSISSDKSAHDWRLKRVPFMGDITFAAESMHAAFATVLVSAGSSVNAAIVSAIVCGVPRGGASGVHCPEGSLVSSESVCGCAPRLQI